MSDETTEPVAEPSVTLRGQALDEYVEMLQVEARRWRRACELKCTSDISRRFLTDDEQAVHGREDAAYWYGRAIEGLQRDG